VVRRAWHVKVLAKPLGIHYTAAVALMRLRKHASQVPTHNSSRVRARALIAMPTTMALAPSLVPPQITSLLFVPYIPIGIYSVINLQPYYISV
jgi:hypothetical protein